MRSSNTPLDSFKTLYPHMDIIQQIDLLAFILPILFLGIIALYNKEANRSLKTQQRDRIDILHLQILDERKKEYAFQSIENPINSTKKRLISNLDDLHLKYVNLDFDYQEILKDL